MTQAVMDRGGGMGLVMWGMELHRLLAAVVLVLGLAALPKHLSFGRSGR